jgi:hypothetical protein
VESHSRSERHFISLREGKGGWRKSVIVLESSQDSSVRPAEKSSMKTKSSEWLEEAVS